MFEKDEAKEAKEKQSPRDALCFLFAQTRSITGSLFSRWSEKGRSCRLVRSSSEEGGALEGGRESASGNIRRFCVDAPFPSADGRSDGDENRNRRAPASLLDLGLFSLLDSQAHNQGIAGTLEA